MVACQAALHTFKYSKRDAVPGTSATRLVNHRDASFRFTSHHLFQHHLHKMASSPEPRDATHDGLDDLFDYDIDEADLRTLDISVPEPKTPPREAEGDDLGLDAEVKVAKARRPTVKLDEKRYC